MATRNRVQTATGYQHVTAIGNNGQDTFLDDEDRLFYLDLLEAAIKEFAFDVAAYCLMRNHVHILARFNGLNMDKVMHKLHTRYANYFNRHHGKTGHLFQRRYENEVVSTVEYLHEAGRYVHMNPVVERLVARPEDYRWSSFREYWEGKFRIVSPDSPLVTAYKPTGVFERQAFHDFTTARSRAAADSKWYERKSYAPARPSENPLQEAADRNHPTVKRIIEGVCIGFGFWGDLREASKRSAPRDKARSLGLYLLKEALPAWSFERLKRLVGIGDRKNVYRIYQRCEARLAFDPGFRQVAADVRASLRPVKA